MKNLKENSLLVILYQTFIYLFLASSFSFVLIAIVGTAFGIQERNNPISLFLIMMGGTFIGGTLWARAILKTRKSSESIIPALRVGLIFGIAIFICGYGLELIEQDLFKNNLLNSPQVHYQYLVSFSLAIIVTTFATSLAILSQIRNFQSVIKGSLYTGIISVATFVGIDAIMYLIGWRVGNIDFPERSTMLIVTGIGLSAAAIIGAIMIGRQIIFDK